MDTQTTAKSSAEILLSELSIDSLIESLLSSKTLIEKEELLSKLATAVALRTDAKLPLKDLNKRMVHGLITSDRFYTHNGYFYDRDKLITLREMEYFCQKAGLYLASDYNLVIEGLLKKAPIGEPNPYDSYGGHLNHCTTKPAIYDALLTPDLEFVLQCIAFGKIPYFIILGGINKAGKSIIMRILQHMFKGFVGAVTIESINSQFGLAPYSRNLLCMGDDLGVEHLSSNVGSFKSIVTGNTVLINEKHKSQYPLQVQANTVLGCNLLPVINVEDDGLMRRLLYFKFSEKLDVMLFNDDTEELEAQIKQAAEYLFTHRHKVDRTRIEAINKQSQIDFFDAHQAVIFHKTRLPSHNPANEYRSYVITIDMMGLKPVSEIKYKRIVTAYKELIK